jgi:hypothetical protein
MTRKEREEKLKRLNELCLKFRRGELRARTVIDRDKGNTFYVIRHYLESKDKKSDSEST